MSDGSIAMVNEFRRIGHPGEVRMSMYGTKGSYEEQYNSRIWLTSELKKFTELSDILCAAEDRNFQDLGGGEQAVGGDWLEGNFAKIQPVDILPKEYKGLGNGHKGSHQFLIHEFVSACVNNVQPENNVWQAARYLVPGLIAHNSAMQGGTLMPVHDFGNVKDCSCHKGVKI